MTLTRLGVIIVLSLVCNACKVVNHHVFKLTSRAEIGTSEAILKTTVGELRLSAQHFSAQERELISSLRPFQCLKITTSEPYDMQSRTVRFNQFKMTKLLESQAECRKVKVRTRISGTFTS